MTRKLWSINALATEFGLDRRTVGLRIKDIPPAGQERGNPVWRLRDVAAVLAPEARNQPANGKPPVPPGFEALDGLAPFDAAATFMALAIVYRIGPLVSALAVNAGAPCKVAFAVGNAATVAVMQEVQQIGEGAGLEPFTSQPAPSLYEPDHFAQADWKALAKVSGEPVDLPAWQAHAQSIFAEKELKNERAPLHGNGS